MSQNTPSRRDILKLFGFGLIALRVSDLLGIDSKAWAAKKAVALPPGQSALPAGDSLATALGYKANVADIDYAKFPARKKTEAKNQFCKNCKLYTQSNEGWGKCQILPAGLVAAEGWCSSYVKKA